ncbi:PRC-barrel domain-containing protein [Dendrosporobacter sp. 1207_IL3150]|uniref:PRC-barrel domain-containing protein n=1 Tax=Dendrosporobacter sp. 1207_IL3150 TaxID=3084054 RepID=UPI002FD9BE06
MKKSVEILGLPIISISEGRELGRSRFLVINPEQGVVAALAIEDDKWYQGAKLLPFSAVTAIGEYAITINSSADILPIADAADLEKLLESNIQIIGTRVITKAGRIQGKITEIVVDETGTISVCELEDTTGQISEIPAQRVFTFGKEVTIISDGEIKEAKPASSKTDALKSAETAPVIKPVAVQEEPVIAQEVVPPAPVAPADKAENEEDTSSKKFDERHRKYLLGKKASRRIETDNGVLIVEQGSEITEEVLQKAKLAGKFVELSMNIQ